MENHKTGYLIFKKRKWNSVNDREGINKDCGILYKKTTEKYLWMLIMNKKRMESMEKTMEGNLLGKQITVYKIVWEKGLY